MLLLSIAIDPYQQNTEGSFIEDRDWQERLQTEVKAISQRKYPKIIIICLCMLVLKWTGGSYGGRVTVLYMCDSGASFLVHSNSLVIHTIHPWSQIRIPGLK